MLVGRSHECDYPTSIQDRAVLTAARTKFENSQQMHDAVVDTLNKEGDAGMGLYTVDAPLMERLAPDVIVTQSLCEVCSVDMRLVEKLCGQLVPRPRIMSLNPFTLEEVLQDCLSVGEAIGEPEAARRAVASLRARAVAVEAFVASRPPPAHPKVGWMEWTEPIFCGGHWTPQLIHMAGGQHPLNPPKPGGGGDSSRAIHNHEFAAVDPDWVVVAPCGFDLDQTKRELNRITDQGWWRELRAVKEGRVVLVDGNQMFNRPGPRLVDGLEFLAGLLHGEHAKIPEGFPWEWWRPSEVHGEPPAAGDPAVAAAAAAEEEAEAAAA